MGAPGTADTAASLSAFTSIPAGTSGLTTGTALDNGTLRSNHSVFVTAAGAPTAGVVTLQVSQDGTNWFSSTTTLTIAAVGVQSTSLAVVARYVRASITTAITGGTVLCTVGSSIG